MDDDECDDLNQCRAKWLFLCVLVCVAMVALGLAIGFLIDWMQGRILR